MDFAHSTWLDGHQCNREFACYGEGGGVNDLDAAAVYDVGLLLREVVGVGHFVGDRAGGTGSIRGGGSAGEDVDLVLWGLVES